MNQAKHTPGPWRVEQGGNFCLVVPPTWPESPNYGGGAICELDNWTGSKHDPDNPKVLPNAHLIAAAPELLEACKALIRELDQVWHDIGQVNRNLNCTNVEAAIAKAEGREP